MHKHVFGHDLYFSCIMQPIQKTNNVFKFPLACLLKETLVSVKICVSKAFPHGVLGIYSVCANSLVRAWGDISAQHCRVWDGQPCSGNLTAKGTGISWCHQFLNITGLRRGLEKSHSFLGRSEVFYKCATKG